MRPPILEGKRRCYLRQIKMNVIETLDCVGYDNVVVAFAQLERNGRHQMVVFMGSSTTFQWVIRARELTKSVAWL